MSEGGGEPGLAAGRSPLFEAVWAAILIGVPLLVASFSAPLPYGVRSTAPVAVAAQRPPSPLPPVEPVTVLEIAPREARAINAAVPFSTAPNPAARPFRFAGSAGAEDRAVDCLAAAQYYEAGDDGPGQKAVAQVVLNRLRHPAFPKTVCGVVFQGSERSTGCQFTFTCDGALARHRPSDAAWDRARLLARQMLKGSVDGRVGQATHYHTDWVVPYWSSSLDKITMVGTHLFFRWKGWWGTPAAFHGAVSGQEPAIAKLAFLSPSHRSGAGGLADAPGVLPLALPGPNDAALAIGPERIGDRFGPARLAAINSLGDAFAMIFDRGTRTAGFEQLARQMCAGRTRCRLLGWTRASDAPNGFPVDDATLATMSFAYMRVADSGLERVLYNCKEFPDMPRSRCMRERLPVAAPQPAPPRAGQEVIRLTP